MVSVNETPRQRLENQMANTLGNKNLSWYVYLLCKYLCKSRYMIWWYMMSWFASVLVPGELQSECPLEDLLRFCSDTQWCPWPRSTCSRIWARLRRESLQIPRSSLQCTEYLSETEARQTNSIEMCPRTPAFEGSSQGTNKIGLGILHKPTWTGSSKGKNSRLKPSQPGDWTNVDWCNKALPTRAFSFKEKLLESKLQQTHRRWRKRITAKRSIFPWKTRHRDRIERPGVSTPNHVAHCASEGEVWLPQN